MYLGMLNPQLNVGKLRNGVFTIQFAYFQDGHQIEEKNGNCRVTYWRCQTGADFSERFNIFSHYEVFTDINVCN